ncbi:Alpha-galactosidase AgaA [Petrocella atlantisensis]|uniref:Alpha-galactosidase n=1 Tax=Petrocella atlantisensis TaxID=2173034 RepID=A0A3P7PWS5_9FIRM|nr:alpha-galactosidase [Petrocella atlantisensis]PKM54792.1 MAG: alpha-galactosidase [Firmicutes bacterium HGW-Firmicutes-5]VDN47681.1 Alpha-galactosidase AgaA [Petrocella atlantisensis]
MGIEFKQDRKRFHLSTKNTSYMMEVVLDRHLVHGYWGKRIHTPDLECLVDLYEVCSFSPNPEKNHKYISFDTMPREYPDYGRSDYQSPAFEVRVEDGNHLCAPVYKSHRIYKGKPFIEGLPSLYANKGDEVDTLEITLMDDLIGLGIVLHYSVYADYDVITRRVTFVNEGKRKIQLEKSLSCSVDFYQDQEFELMHLYGGWAKERHISRIPIGHSTHVIDSKRGASSHEQNPFIALLRPDTTEHVGEVYAMNLIYSGSFMSEVSVNSYEGTRMQMGLNTIDFEWDLGPNTSFDTPEVVMVYSDKGLNGMSKIFHNIYKDRLCRGKWQHQVRPILINNWEATYFDFDEQKIKKLIDESAGLGIELMVLDDGWFGKRDSDSSGLGDWFVNKEKLPSGLKVLADYANSKGMDFGLWFEPEMVSPDSALYRKHPDWCLHIPNRERSEARNQLVLDMGREDVRNYLYLALEKILESAPIGYVKWDMNRNMTEVGSAILQSNHQKETSHRYILGLYDLLDRITKAFPDVLFESCSGGGGRFDPGMLYYMPQTWTSDDTDSFERLKIQWGTSMLYPPITMGAHVSEVPNHQVMRKTPLHTRAYVAMAANLGFELDLTKLSTEEKGAVKNYIDRYKLIRETVQFGDFYRLMSPYETNGTAWMFISKERNQVVLFYYRHLAKPNHIEPKIKLCYLDPKGLYRMEDGQQLYGDTLMHYGLRLPTMTGDFDSVMIILEKVI